MHLKANCDWQPAQQPVSLSCIAILARGHKRRILSGFKLPRVPRRPYMAICSTMVSNHPPHAGCVRPQAGSHAGSGFASV